MSLTYKINETELTYKIDEIDIISAIMYKLSDGGLLSLRVQSAFCDK